MLIDNPNPMIPPIRHIPVPPKEIAWIIFKHGFMRWMPDDLVAPLLLVVIPGLVFVVLVYFATKDVEDDQQLQGS